MKLLYTPNSPYSRIVRFIILEWKLDIELIKVEVRESVGKLLEFNLVGKVPSLVLNEGIVLSDTRIICQHLERLSSHKIIAEIDDYPALQIEGFVMGFLDGIAVLIRELSRANSDQSASIIQLEKSRVNRCLSYFESNWEFDNSHISFATITLACAIDIFNSRVGSFWKKDCPLLAKWVDEYLDQTNMIATAPLPVFKK